MERFAHSTQGTESDVKRGEAKVLIIAFCCVISVQLSPPRAQKKSRVLRSPRLA